MILWMMTSLFGGMIFYLFVCSFAVIPVLLGYIVSLIDTSISIFKKGVSVSETKKYSHMAVGGVLSVILILNSEILKSNALLSATLRDDLFHYQLIFRENGTVENLVHGFAGFEETHYGKYNFKGDTIVFSKVPYDNDFIPDTLYINREQNALFMYRNDDGSFSDEKTWLSYFEIDK
ncbi:hypothetical protein [Lewinella sp. JB7]|uniref:hypothetical protein n=1 Tax=Lewinella sp. JB7 TaxID=2962887 RepID=UPI0020CA091F|nr:hypothetical protein [Lewinella sp. JB7]MCP9237966.1 hypothetical protein [Lewinella sp. JB7]